MGKDEKKSCLDCMHFDMCGWKGTPHLCFASHPGGFPAIDYARYRIDWYILQGENCKRFLGSGIRIPKTKRK